MVEGTDEAPAAAPERLLLVPVLRDREGTRFVLVRWPDWPHPAMLSLAPPSAADTVDAAAGDLVRGRLHMEPAGLARIAQRRIPVRMAAARFGMTGTTGWLRATMLPVSGALDPDLLLESAEALDFDTAVAALPTEVERMLLRDAAELVPES